MFGYAACVVVIVASALQNENFRKAYPTIADFYTEQERQAFRQKFVWFIAGGVGAILFAVAGILCAVVSIALDPYKDEE